MGSNNFWLKLTRFDGKRVWDFFLGIDHGSKSQIFTDENVKQRYDKLFEFQHPKKYFDDFKQNIILRVLDERIQIFHDRKGLNYFPSEYVTDDKIKKPSIKSLTIQSDSSGKSIQRWTIQRVEIKSG